jgi:hypothetical protein
VTGIPNLLLFHLVNVEGLGDGFLEKYGCFGNLLTNTLFGNAGHTLMISAHSIHVAGRAKEIYRRRLQAELEAAHRDRYVAIEPESGEHLSPVLSVTR